jgi:hypothetical protein
MDLRVEKSAGSSTRQSRPVNRNYLRGVVLPSSPANPPLREAVHAPFPSAPGSHGGSMAPRGWKRQCLDQRTIIAIFISIYVSSIADRVNRLLPARPPLARVGNHDAALYLPQVWGLLAAPPDVPAGRVALVTRGFWMSTDGRIVAEHAIRSATTSTATTAGRSPRATSAARPISSDRVRALRAADMQFAGGRVRDCRKHRAGNRRREIPYR